MTRKVIVSVVQVLLVLVALAALAFLILEPQVEGRNAHATPAEIYLGDGLLAYAYLGSLAFFTGIYWALRGLGCVRRGETISSGTAESLRWIRNCAMVLLGFIAFSVVFFASADPEDRPAGLFMRLLVGAPTGVVFLVSRVLERRVRKALGAAVGEVG